MHREAITDSSGNMRNMPPIRVDTNYEFEDITEPMPISYAIPICNDIHNENNDIEHMIEEAGIRKADEEYDTMLWEKEEQEAEEIDRQLREAGII